MRAHGIIVNYLLTQGQTEQAGRPAPPPPPHQTLHFPADTVCGPVSLALVWSAMSVRAVDNSMDKLHKS